MKGIFLILFFFLSGFACQDLPPVAARFHIKIIKPASLTQYTYIYDNFRTRQRDQIALLCLLD